MVVLESLRFYIWFICWLCLYDSLRRFWLSSILPIFLTIGWFVFLTTPMWPSLFISDYLPWNLSWKSLFFIVYFFLIPLIPEYRFSSVSRTLWFYWMNSPSRVAYSWEFGKLCILSNYYMLFLLFGISLIPWLFIDCILIFCIFLTLYYSSISAFLFILSWGLICRT